MTHFKLIAERLAKRFRASWDRLSATQRLTARGAGLVVLLLAVGGLAGLGAPRPIEAADDAGRGMAAVWSQFRFLHRSLDTTAGALELARLEVKRTKAILGYSATYQIPADLAETIYETALQEGLDPDLAFRLVKLESQFKPKARSHAGAVGLAQVQLATAKYYEPGLTQEKLYDPETNLRVGFRFLRDLLTYYGDVKLALLAYNRGPTRVKQLLDAGRDPRNGYASTIMQGYGAER